MDRNSVIGLSLIGLILIAFSILNSPSAEEMAAEARQRDSLALIEKQKEVLRNPPPVAQAPSLKTDSSISDSALQVLMSDELGPFAASGTGQASELLIENEKIKVTLSTLGGSVKSVELKEYKTSAGQPVVLFEGDSSRFNLNFFARNRSISTGNLHFKPSSNGFKVSGNDSNSVSLRLFADSPDRYIEYIYSLKGNGYLVGYEVRFVGLKEVIAGNAGFVEIDWKQRIRAQEKDLANERANSTVYYQFIDGETDHLSETSDDADELNTRIRWVAMKQQFFTQVLIAPSGFDKPSRISTLSGSEEENWVKDMQVSLTLPYTHSASESHRMQFYFGPNHYQILKRSGYALESQIPLGWGIFGWVNRFIVIPIFNFLNSFNWNYAIIILVLTIVIKLMLLPLTFKAYLSQAKMKVLKPEMEEIQGKHKEDPMKLQQEMLGLYRKAGVNPLGGCLPMLLQLPILIAMFRFFPQSIELRQEGFWWSTDLSTYDSILDLPFKIPFYGDHVSLWTLLMTISTLLITLVNSSSTMTNPQMKWMMYLMPVVFLGVFNNYSAGLSYYYFLANMISIGQQYLFRAFVDEDKIHRQIQENKKKPQSQKKSGFQERLEKMAKERGYKLPKQ